MEEKDQNEVFYYNYSAEQQAEVERIRKKYLPQEADKMERLRMLDAGVTRKGTAVSLIIGVISSLFLGVGMCLFMTDIGAALGSPLSEILGIVVGLLGIGGAIAAYPVYQRIVERERARVAPEILRLTEELLK